MPTVTFLLPESAKKKSGNTVERTVEAPAGTTCSQAVFMHDLAPVKALCSGLGKCGKCKVRFLSHPPAPLDAERRKLSQDELAEGYRLSCLHTVADGMRIELPGAAPAFPVQAQAVSDSDTIAVDLGTTSIHWAAIRQGETLDTGSELNPQIGAGSEVMSRIAFALSGNAKHLRQVVLNRLNKLARDNGSPQNCCISGNPAMTCLLLGKSVDGLAAAPYSLPYAGGETVELDGFASCYIPPQFAPFVGGDLSAGLIHLLHTVKAKPPFLLADLGTNGEFILALPDNTFLAASVPMGPALEGVGLSSGMVAGPGAAVAFEQSPLGPEPILFPGTTGQAEGISGTGYISLAAALLRLGTLGPEGGFNNGPTLLSAKAFSRLTTRQGETDYPVSAKAAMSASDIEEMLKVKAAFNTALATLLDESGLAANDLTWCYLAGALGEHVSIDDLARLGFLPQALAARTVAAGNTSLKGAVLLADSIEARKKLEALVPRVRTLDLTSAPDFGKRYIQRMLFEYVQ